MGTSPTGVSDGNAMGGAGPHLRETREEQAEPRGKAGARQARFPVEES